MTNTTTEKPRRGRPPKSSRPERVPMNGQRLRMELNEEECDPAFHYAWINDDKDLIYRAKRAGYEHVTLDEVPSWGQTSVDSANPVDSLVSMPVGQGKTAFLMKQPMEYYEQDREASDNIVNDREADLKKSLNSGQNGTYGAVEIS